MPVILPLCAFVDWPLRGHSHRGRAWAFGLQRIVRGARCLQPLAASNHDVRKCSHFPNKGSPVSFLSAFGGAAIVHV